MGVIPAELPTFAFPEFEWSRVHTLAGSSCASVIVLRLKRARNLDAVCLRVLDRFLSHMQAAEVRVLLCGLRPDLVKVLDASGLRSRLGAEQVFAFEETGAI